MKIAFAILAATVLPMLFFASSADAASAQLLFSEVNFSDEVPGDTKWIEFKVITGGTLNDTLIRSSSTTNDTRAIGSGQAVLAGDYVVLWLCAGIDDVAKAGGLTAGAWDIYLVNGLTMTDCAYQILRQDQTTIDDFVAWSDIGASFSKSMTQSGLPLAIAQGQWENLGDTYNSFDCVLSYGATDSWGIKRNNNADDTNSKYGWELYWGDGTRGAANGAFRNYQGTGRWELNPATTVDAGASGTWEFIYRTGKYEFGDNNTGGCVTLTVPAGWTKPQDTDPAAPGYVRIYPRRAVVNTAQQTDNAGDTYCTIRDTVIIVALNYTDSTDINDSLTITYGYGGGAAAAVAPVTPGSYEFSMRSDPWGRNVSLLDSSPILTVVSGVKPQVFLKNVASCTLYPDSTNATLLAGRVVGDTVSGDTLLGLTVRNLGTANTGDTKDSGIQGGISLWRDVNGDSAWDTGDSWVSTLNYRGAGIWGFSSSTVLMPGGVFSFVVTTNISSTPVDLHTFQLQVDSNYVATSARGLGPVADTTNSGTQTISVPYVYTAYAPFITSLIMDSHSVSKLLAEQTYTCTAVFTDSNGFGEIDTCVILINSVASYAAGDSCAYFMFNENNRRFYLWSDTTSAWIDCGDTAAFTANSNSYVTLAGGTATRSGNNLTIGWTFQPKFGWEDEACTVYANVTDSVPSSAGWQARTTASTENDLTFSGAAAVTSGYHGGLTSYGFQWVRTGETLTWSGLTVVYQGTTVSPNSVYYDIRIADTDASTDTIDITGVLDTITVAGKDAGVDTYRFTIINRPGGSDVSDTWFTLQIDPTVPNTLTLGSSGTSNSVTLTWTACTDDGLSPWSTYEVFYNTTGAPTAADTKWSSANDAALAIRTTATTTVTGLNSSTTYYFVIRGVDTATNYGVLSVAKSQATTGVLTSFRIIAPATVYRGETFSITIAALDAGGDTLTSFTDSVVLDANTGNILPVNSAGFTAGVRIEAVSLDTTGVIIISATYGNDTKTFLAPGDIAITGLNSDAPELVDFVALVNIAPGVEILFTENGWSNTGDTWRFGEAEKKWTAPAAGVLAGTVIRLTWATPDASLGTLTSVSGATGISTTDQIIAFQYQGADTVFLYAITNGQQWAAEVTSTSNSALPDQLTSMFTATNFLNDNGYYSGATVTGTRNQLLTAISDSSNWTTLGTTLDAATWLGACTVTAASATGTTTVTVLANRMEVFLKDVSSCTIYPDSTNVTVLAGKVFGRAGGDTLTHFEVVNLGTVKNTDTRNVATYGGLSLWRDVNGDSAWDAGDSWICKLNVLLASPNDTTWGCTFTGLPIYTGINFVVTANVSSAPTNLRYFRLGIEQNTILSTVAEAGPSADTANSGKQTIWVAPSNPGDVIITEVSWGGVGGGAGTEWFELYNTTNAAISLNNWQIGDYDGAGCTHTFSGVSIPARSYFLCEAEEAATSVAANDIYGDDAGNLNLAAGGDDLRLFDAGGNLIDMIDFTAAWPAGAAAGGLGNGFVAMERRNLDTAVSSSTGSNWLYGPYTVACGALGGISGTPGAVNSMAAYDNLKINEVMVDDHASPDESEWVELYNSGDTPINIFNWVVTEHDGTNKIMPCMAITKKAYIVVHFAAGSDETSFSGTNNVMHLYAGTANTLTNTTRDAVGLYTASTPDMYNVIDFVAWAVTPGTALDDAQAAVDGGHWPSTSDQVNYTNAPGRTIYRVQDGADSNTTDTGDWTQLLNTGINRYSCGGTNKSNQATALTAVTGCTVIWTTTDATGYQGAVGDSAFIRLTGTDNDPTCTDVTNCTVVSTATDGSGKVVLKLTETGLNTGIFEGWLLLRNMSSDALGWIGCATGEVVTIRSVDNPAYYDTIVLGASINPSAYSLVLNEFLANSGGTSDTEFIEIYNPTDTPIRIAGCYLDDAAGGGSFPYLIPNTGTAADTIAPRGFKVYYGSVTGLQLSNSSDDVRFLSADSSTIGIHSYSSSSYNVSEGCCYDGASYYVLFDGVNDPGTTPGATNNPAPVITGIVVTSDGDSIYSDGVVDTSVPGGVYADTVWFSSAYGVQNITITVSGLYTYNDAFCSGTTAFGDASHYAVQATMPYTETYSIEAAAASQDITIYVTDTCGAGDSLTLRFVQDNDPPVITLVAHTDVTTLTVGAFTDTVQITDTGVGCSSVLDDTPQQRFRWGATGTWGVFANMDSRTIYFTEDTTTTWAVYNGDTLYWQVKAWDRVGNLAVTNVDDANARELVNPYSGPWYVNDWNTGGDGLTTAVGLDTNPGTSGAPFRTIFKALTSAVAGDTIYVDAGVYSESVVVSKNSLWVIGYDSRTVRIDPPAGQDGIRVTSDTVRLRNLGIADAVQGIELNGADTCEISSCSVTATSAEGIYLTSAHGNSLLNNRVDSTLLSGIYLTVANNNRMFNNTVLKSDDGIFLTSTCLNVVIDSCTVMNSRDDGLRIGTSCTGASITNNYIYNNIGEGIYLAVDSCYVYNNRIDSSGADGITLTTSRGTILDSNSITNGKDDGITIGNSDSCVVKNNFISASVSQGIYILDADSNTFSNNRLDANVAHGIYIDAGTSYNNNIDGCTVTNGGNDGILLGSDSNAVRNCYIYNNFSEGIYFSNGVDTCTIYNNTVDSNVIAGIYCQGTHNTIDSNAVTRTVSTGYGIYVNADINTITNNRMNQNRVYGIYFTGADTCSVTGNRISNGLSSANGIYLNNARGNYFYNNFIDSNTSRQVYILGGSSNNWFDSNTIVRGVGNFAAFALDSSDSNAFSRNLMESGYDGFVVWTADSNTLQSNLIRYNSNCGIYLGGASTGNTISSCTSVNNNYGCYLEGATRNTFSSNVLRSNWVDGFCLNGDTANTFYQNECDSNVSYQVRILTGSGNDTFVKNNFTPSPGNPTWAVNVVPATGFHFERNWWTTTDTTKLYSYISGAGRTGIDFWPFRLGRVDTAVAADTVAPRAPDTVAAASQSETRALITWSASSGSEEAEGAAALNGYRIYRARTSDSHYWVKVGDVGAATDSYSDSGLTQDSCYYYRVTAYDNHSPWENESFYSDSIAACTPTVSNLKPTVIIMVPVDGDTYGGSVTCTYSIADANSNSCTITVQYSWNNGATWTAATVTGSCSGVAADANGETYTFTWYTLVDLPDTTTCVVKLRVFPYDGTETGAADTTNFFGIDNQAPNAPTGLTATADTAVPDTGVWLAWNSVTGDTRGYYVYVDTDGNGFAQRLTATPLTVTSFLADSRYVRINDTYIFYVTCVDSVGNESLHSETATAPILLPFKLLDSVALGGLPAVAKPGATVWWRLGARNRGFGPSDTVVIIDHVRPGTTYVVNSADTVAANGYRATIEYSNDTGATWSSSQVLVPRVTSIRWTIPRWFITGSVIEVKFAATID